MLIRISDEKLFGLLVEMMAFLCMPWLNSMILFFYI